MCIKNTFSWNGFSMTTRNERLLEEIILFLDGHIKNYEDEKGEQITYRLKDDVRFKPLEYLCEGMDIDLFEEVK